MEIRKCIYVFILLFAFVSCKKSIVDGQINNTSILKYSETSDFKKVSYFNKYIYDARINIFEFRDRNISVEYLTDTLFGIQKNQNFSVYRSAFDLDLGELDLLRFDNDDSQIYLIELKESRQIIYNIYILYQEKVYYLGNLNFETGLDKKGNTPIINIKKNNLNVEIEILNGTTKVKKEYALKAALPIYKSFNKLQEYLQFTEINIDVKTNFSKQFKNEFFNIGVNNDVLVVKVEGVDTEYLNYEILEGNTLCPDISLDKIALKNKVFTIEKYNCNNDYYMKEFITFIYSKDLLLNNYSIEYTSRKNPDQEIVVDHFTTKDFGILKFDEVDKKVLNSMRQK